MVTLLPAPGGRRAGPGFLREFQKVPEPFLDPPPQGAPPPLREQLPEGPAGRVQPVGVTTCTPTREPRVHGWSCSRAGPGAAFPQQGKSDMILAGFKLFFACETLPALEWFRVLSSCGCLSWSHCYAYMYNIEAAILKYGTLLLRLTSFM